MGRAEPAIPALVLTHRREGEPLTYTLTVSETRGLFHVTSMVVSDAVPLNTTCCLTISHGGFQTGGDVLWVGQTVSSSHAISLTFVVTVSQVSSGTTITNGAYRAVISTTKAATGATGSPVSITVRTRPLAVHLPLILKSQ